MYSVAVLMCIIKMLKPTHIDSQMGAVLRPEFIRRYIKVGIGKDIPVMMDKDIKEVIEKVGIILTTWRQLKQRRQAIIDG